MSLVAKGRRSVAAAADDALDVFSAVCSVLTDAGRIRIVCLRVCRTAKASLEQVALALRVCQRLATWVPDLRVKYLWLLDLRVGTALLYWVGALRLFDLLEMV